MIYVLCLGVEVHCITMFFFSRRRRHTRFKCDWSSDVCSSDLETRNHTHDRRPRIEHIETIAPSDIPRFGKLGVIASMQPLHSYPDTNTLDVWARNIGPDRASRAWAWKSIAEAGGH